MIGVINHLHSIIRGLKSDSKIIHEPPLSTNIAIRIPSIDKANEILGFKAKVDLEEGVFKTASWIEENLFL